MDLKMFLMDLIRMTSYGLDYSKMSYGHKEVSYGHKEVSYGLKPIPYGGPYGPPPAFCPKSEKWAGSKARSF